MFFMHHLMWIIHLTKVAKCLKPFEAREPCDAEDCLVYLLTYDKTFEFVDDVFERLEVFAKPLGAPAFLRQAHGHHMHCLLPLQRKEGKRPTKLPSKSKKCRVHCRENHIALFSLSVNLIEMSVFAPTHCDTNTALSRPFARKGVRLAGTRRVVHCFTSDGRCLQTKALKLCQCICLNRKTRKTSIDWCWLQAPLKRARHFWEEFQVVHNQLQDANAFAHGSSEDLLGASKLPVQKRERSTTSSFLGFSRSKQTNVTNNDRFYHKQ